MDVMHIELENNSAPSLKDYIEKNDIHGIGFDLDSTLIDTHSYVDEGLFCVGMTIAEQLEVNISSEEIAFEIVRISREIYAENNYRPMLMPDLCYQAVGRYKSEEFAIEMKDFIDDTLEYFYLHSPEPYSKTKYVIETIRSFCLPIIVHSDAQEGWTDIKIQRLKEDIGFTLLYLATDLKRKKGFESWKEAVTQIERDMSEMLIVGDSLKSDIIPALEAGCKHVVWLNHFGKELPEELKGRVYVITKIEDLLYL